MDEDDEIHVHCPFCSNKRLFDTTESNEGIIKIKCPSCKVVAVINLTNISEAQKKKRLRAYQKVSRQI